MLLLSRKINEKIVIDDNIVITVLDIRGGNARLGIAAPREVLVHRQEVYDAIHGKTATNNASAPAVSVTSADR
jgi:carbon storage regulator